jgi:hypothetical protein
MEIVMTILNVLAGICLGVAILIITYNGFKYTTGCCCHMPVDKIKNSIMFAAKLIIAGFIMLLTEKFYRLGILAHVTFRVSIAGIIVSFLIMLRYGYYYILPQCHLNDSTKKNLVKSAFSLFIFMTLCILSKIIK